MIGKTESIFKEYDYGCMLYVNTFCIKQGTFFEEWVDYVGGIILTHSDHYLNFRDVKIDIDTNQPQGKIFEWYDEVFSNGNGDVNYENWLKKTNHTD